MYIFSNIEALQTIAQVKALFAHWIEQDGLIFHPDTPMEDYVNGDSGEQALEVGKTTHYNRLLDRCFQICESSGTDIYLLGLECFRSTHPDIFS